MQDALFVSFLLAFLFSLSCSSSFFSILLFSFFQLLPKCSPHPQGVRALMRGCLMRVARVAPGMGLTFMCVEKVKEFGRSYDKRGRE
jgi:hypothetical protein